MVFGPRARVGGEGRIKMNVGMLWYDDDKSRSLEEKVRRAADYYQRKYGRKPNLCLVNPQSGLNGKTAKVASVELKTAGNVLPHHFWVGVAEV